jgi:hypothetical protein
MWDIMRLTRKKMKKKKINYSHQRSGTVDEYEKEKILAWSLLPIGTSSWK